MSAHSPSNFPAWRSPSVAYVIDPRFPGGTSSAVAQELRVVAEIVTPRIYGISSRMFAGDTIAPQLEDTLQDLRLAIEWNPAKITADVVVLHNPAFLKFQTELPTRILAEQLFVISHENFLRPGGAEAFDVAACLGQIERAALVLRKTIAPVSAHNRSTVRDWLGRSTLKSDWTVLPDNWFNICDFDMQEPIATPQDRRGRLSRPGFEKFPRLADLELCFPESAQSNVLLGADCLTGLAIDHRHWQIIPFREIEIGQFFQAIDFMVYFTSPSWRESFGRVLAEAVAAGKVVISDEGTASNFENAIIAATPAEVNKVISGFIKQPKKYRNQVKKAQNSLERFSSRAFAEFFRDQVIATRRGLS